MTGGGAPEFEEPNFGNAETGGFADHEDLEGFGGDDFEDDADDEDFEDDADDDEDDEADEVSPVPATEAGNAHDVGHDEHDGANRAVGGMSKAVLEHVVLSLVDDPDSVVIDVSEGRSGIKLSLHVAPSDMGRVIGKRGRVAQAMRTLVRAAAAREGTDAAVDIVDD